MRASETIRTSSSDVMVDEARRTSPDLFSPQVQFLLTDVDLGITFAGLAGMPEYTVDARQRNLRNAQRAYETVQRLLKKTPMSDDERQAISLRLENLRMALEEVRRALP
jgi:hypothetical protein